MSSLAKPFEIRLSARASRQLSLFVYAALFLGYSGLVPDEGSRLLALLAGLLRLGGLAGALILLLSTYGQWSQRAERDLDEREVAVRNRAYVLTHQLIVGVLLLGFLWLTLADRFGWWLPGVASAADLMTAFAFAVMALPAAILAWRDRAEPELDS